VNRADLLPRMATVWLCALALGCSAPGGQQPGDTAQAAPLPGMTVVGVRERGPYLDVVVRDAKRTIRRLVRPTEACRFVLIPEINVGFQNRGIAGRFERADVRCDAVGFGDPLMSRSRRGRGNTGEVIPRDQATFRVLYEDADVILLHGRFPLASLVGFAGGDDCVAVVRNHPPCRRAIEGGVASLEFRPRGPNTLALIGGRKLCRIDALALPPIPESD